MDRKREAADLKEREEELQAFLMRRNDETKKREILSK